LGFDDLVESEAILLVEWGERFRDLMPQEHIEIQLRTIDENARTISMTNISER
jgi:tRNA threonylcarbamoyladenosine biosynthesis protein TsaE